MADAIAKGIVEGDEAEDEFKRILEEAGIAYERIPRKKEKKFGADFRVDETYIQVKAHSGNFKIGLLGHQKLGEQKRGVYVFKLKELKERQWLWLEHGEVGRLMLLGQWLERQEGDVSGETTLYREDVKKEGRDIKLLIARLSKQRKTWLRPNRLSVIL